jgi:hypothetical protein
MRKLTRLAALGVLIASIGLLLPFEANAEKVSISGRHTRAEIAQKCAAVGGDAIGVDNSSGDYSCFNPHKGTSVSCDEKGKCTGYVPRRSGISPRSIDDVLRRPLNNK